MTTMQLERQNIALPVTNFDSVCQSNSFTRHNNLFGGTCKRIIISGPSGSGKTNTLLTLLLHHNGLRFKNIYICCGSLHQEKYAYLRQVLQEVPEIGYHEYTGVQEMITPDRVDDYSVVVFDDIGTTNLDIVKQFFSFGRHHNVDCFYLIQTYSAIPKQLLRDNANLLILFQQDGTNLKHVYNDHIHDLTYEQFMNMCRLCWRNTFNMFIIDTDCKFNEGRYRTGFDTYIRL